MTAAIDGLLRSAISIGGLLAVTAAIAVWIAARPGSRRARRALLAWLASAFVFSTYPLPYAVTRALTAGFRDLTAADIPAGNTAIIVLGAGAFDYRGRDGSVLTHVDYGGAVRVLEAHRVFVMRPDAWVISSGGAIRDEPGAATAAGTMRDALVGLGVPKDRIVLESESQSTRDEAIRIAPLLQSLNVANVIVVTEGFHMRRALGVFRAAGIHAIPAITLPPEAGPSDWWWPSTRGIGFTALMVRELLANTWYWSRGWI